MGLIPCGDVDAGEGRLLAQLEVAQASPSESHSAACNPTLDQNLGPGTDDGHHKLFGKEL